MRYEDLSAEDQKLLNTDLGDFEKEAAEELALAQEMYGTGFNKLANEAADYLDSVFAKVAEDKEEKEDEDDEETKKTAADLGAFIERGFFDGLCKLGQERHGDAAYYLMPYLEEKAAAMGAEKYAGEFAKRVGGYASKAWEKTRGAAGKAYDAAKKAPGKGVDAVKSYHGKAQSQLKGGKEYAEAGKKRLSAVQKGSYGEKMDTEAAKAMIRSGRKDVAKGVAKHVAPYAAGAGALGGLGLGYSALRKKKED